MIQKSLLAMVLAFGMMLPACGSSKSDTANFCDDLVNVLLDKCDPNDVAEAAMLEQFLANLDSELTFDEMVADNGAAAKEECTTGFGDDDLTEEEQAGSDLLLAALDAAESCEAALTIAGALEDM